MKKAKKWFWIGGGVLVLLIIVVIMISRSGNGARETALVTRGDVIQKVSVSGKVEAVQKADLAFEIGGTVKQIVKKEGEAVKSGELVASLDIAELSVRLANQQAALERARLALQDLVDPPKVVEKTSAQNSVALAGDDLKQAKDDALNKLDAAFVAFPSILNDLNDLAISGADYLSDGSIRLQGKRALSYRDEAAAAYWAAKKSYDEARRAYEQGGRAASAADLQSLLAKTYAVARQISEAVKKTYTLVTYLEKQLSVVPDQLNSDKTTLDTHTTEINQRLADLVSAGDDISQADRSATEAQQKLTDLLDGADQNDISSSRLAVRQAELEIADTQVQIAKRQIRAPFDGVVGRNELKLGETVASSDALVTLISANEYQATARVPEADIAKIDVDDKAQITLEAYAPEDLKLEARVSAVNPAEEMIDGVATYKVTLQFLTQNKNLRSGMTTNIEIIGAEHQGVLTIPVRALQLKDGGYVVQIPNGKQVTDKSVTIGLRGADGLVEILSGLNEGETVLVGAE